MNKPVNCNLLLLVHILQSEKEYFLNELANISNMSYETGIENTEIFFICVNF